eukprot:15342331-Alexandrium_andersonii.AAC.1
MGRALELKCRTYSEDGPRSHMHWCVACCRNPRTVLAAQRSWATKGALAALEALGAARVFSLTRGSALTTSKRACPHGCRRKFANAAWCWTHS